MGNKLDIPGEPITTLDKRRVKLFLSLQAAVMLIGGVVAIVLGHLVGIAVALVAVPMFWLGRHIGATQLVVTSAGVYYVRGKGIHVVPQVVESATWDTITEVKLVTSRSTSSSGSSKSHSLRFTRSGDDDQLRYLVGFIQKDRFALLAKTCKEKSIPVTL